MVDDVEVVGDGVNRLPHVLTFSCLFADGEALLDGLDREGFAVGSGSACTADTLQPSHVLAAMGVLTHGNVRIALPSTTPAAELGTPRSTASSALLPSRGRTRARPDGDDGPVSPVHPAAAGRRTGRSSTPAACAARSR